MSSTSVFFVFVFLVFIFVFKMLPVSDQNNRNDLVSVVVLLPHFRPAKVGDIGGLCKERGGERRRS